MKRHGERRREFGHLGGAGVLPAVVLCLLCLWAAGAARAQLFISKDTTIDFPFSAGIYVGTGTGTNRTSPTVSVVNGAQVTGNLLAARNASTVTMSGGLVEYLAGADESTINIGGGTVANLTMRDRSRWTMSGGTIQNSVFQHESTTGTLLGGPIDGAVRLEGAGSQFTMQGGRIGRGLNVGRFAEAWVRDGIIADSSEVRGTLTVSGPPEFDSVNLRGSGKIHLGGGVIETALNARDFSTADVMDGSINFLDGYDFATIRMTGGKVQWLFTNGTSTANIYGGTLRRASAFDSSVINLYGGTIHGTADAFRGARINRYGGRIGGDRTLSLDGLYLHDQSLLSLYGTGLSSRLLDPNYENAFSMYALSGLLSDGTDIAGEYLFLKNGSGAGFELIHQAGTGAAVPEPGTLALLAVGLLLRRRVCR